jgi:hypothetical protein
MLRLLALLLVTSCGAGGSEIILRELTNDKIGNIPVGVSAVTETKQFRKGKRVSIEFATLLVHDTASKTIQKHLISEGDDLVIGGKTYRVTEVERGAEGDRGRVVLELMEN